MRVVFDKYMYRDADGDFPFREYADVGNTGTVTDGLALRKGAPPGAWFAVTEDEYHAMYPEDQMANLNSHCVEQAIIGPDWELAEVRIGPAEHYAWLKFVHDSDVKKWTERLVELDFAASAPPFPTEVHMVPFHRNDFPKLMWRREDL